MARSRRRESAIVLVCSLAACTSDNNEPYDAGMPEPLTAVTYNTGLLPSVGYVEERLPLLKSALTELDAQVLCVQEVWESEHWQALVQANAAARPHVVRIPDDPGAVGKCTPDVFNPLELCAEEACASAPELIPCVAAKCAAQVAKLDSACIQCLLDNSASSDFTAIRAACVGEAMSHQAGMVPPAERSYLSGGSFGIGLLSALPLSRTDQKKLDSSTVRRGIIYAHLDDSPIGPVHLFCTHLGAILPGVKYEGSYGSWEGENAHHTEDLIAFVDEKVSDGEQLIVLGDLNNGPKGKGIVASEPESYAKFAAAGLLDPYLSGPAAQCTFCTDNPLVNPDDEGAQAAIDHILVRGLSGTVTVERIFDELVDIQVESPMSDGGMGGEDAGPSSGTKSATQRVGLSDHYGLRGTFRK